MTAMADRLMAAVENMAEQGALAILCPTCQRLEPLPGCLHLTESAIARMDVEDVIEVHRWVSTTLRRPPVSNGGDAWAPVRSLLEALQRDLALLPTVDAAAEGMPEHIRRGGLAWAPHPAMAASELGIEGNESEPGHIERRRIDGWGIER